MSDTRVVFHYPKKLVDAPIVSGMTEKFGLQFNILRANITPDAEGLLVLELTGDAADIERALDWAIDQGVTVQPLEKDVARDEDACTHCGACVTICPTGALHRDEDTDEIVFDASKCTACELCVPACPPRAMSVQF